MGRLEIAHVDAALTAFLRARRREDELLRFQVGSSIQRSARHAPLATANLLAEIERQLPHLRASAPPPTGLTAGDCDVLDQTPLLCVGGSGNNTHSTPAVLSIDLGGDDTYTNTAAGAPFLPSGGKALLPLAVVVDVDGDDMYTPSPAAGLDGMLVGSGAGAFGSVGILVDASGRDSYISSEAPGSAGTTFVSYTQGAGAGGTGVLFDLQGSDIYRSSGRDGVRDWAYVVAQGAAEACTAGFSEEEPYQVMAGCGIAGLLDLGGGNDSYSVDAGEVTGSAPGALHPIRVASGQGVGDLGDGILLDDGGIDDFDLRAGASDVSGDHYPGILRPGVIEGSAPWAFTRGQGYGVAGTGMLLTGPGPSRYDMTAKGEGWALNLVRGQGAGLAGGFGALDDLSGGDSYAVRSNLEMAVDETIGDGCGCPLRRQFDGVGFPSVSNMIAAQGYSETGTGFLRDHAGDDSYAAGAVSTIEVRLSDVRTDPVGNVQLHVSGYKRPLVAAQGASNAGNAVLVDVAGTDSYSLSVLRRTRALFNEGGDAVAYSPAALASWGQGAVSSGGVGALLDLSGEGDRFSAVARDETASSTDPDGAFTMGQEWSAFQGASLISSRAGVLAALGSSPEILSSPARGVCGGTPGYRGYGTWVECSATSEDPSAQSPDYPPGFAAGVAPLATGAPTTIEFLESGPLTIPPSTAPDGRPAISDARADVSLRVLDATGAPLAGASVRIDLQALLPEFQVEFPEPTALTRRWENLWEVTAETDASGRASVALPVDYLRAMRLICGGDEICLSTRDLRVMATFDGGPGRYPDHALRSISISSSGVQREP